MISYDDLVAALAAWRTRQGLPVAQQAAAAPSARGRAAPAGHAAPAAPAGHAAKAAPAAAARPAAPRGAAPPPPQAPHSDYDDAALVEDSYDSGEDFVMQLGGAETGESTAIGSAPEPSPPAPAPPARGKRPGW